MKNIKISANLFLFSAVLIFAYSCASDKSAKEPAFQPEVSMAEAKKQIDEGFYEEARKILEDVRSKDTSQHYAILAMIRIADTYYDDQQYDEAAVEYENFLNVHPFHKYAAYAQYKLGMTYFKKIKTMDIDARINSKVFSVKDFQFDDLNINIHQKNMRISAFEAVSGFYGGKVDLRGSVDFIGSFSTP